MAASRRVLGLNRTTPVIPKMPSGSRTRPRLRRPLSFVGVEPTAQAFPWKPPPRHLEDSGVRAPGPGESRDVAISFGTRVVLSNEPLESYPPSLILALDLTGT